MISRNKENFGKTRCTKHLVEFQVKLFQVISSYKSFVCKNLNHYQSKWMFLHYKSMNVSVKRIFLKIWRRYMSTMILSQFYYWMLGHSQNMHVTLKVMVSYWVIRCYVSWKHSYRINIRQMIFSNILKILASFWVLFTSFRKA